METPLHHVSLNGNCWPSVGSESAWPPPGREEGVGVSEAKEHLQATRFTAAAVYST